MQLRLLVTLALAAATAACGGGGAAPVTGGGGEGGGSLACSGRFAHLAALVPAFLHLRRGGDEPRGAGRNRGRPLSRVPLQNPEGPSTMGAAAWVTGPRLNRS